MSVRYEVADHIATITIDRPDKRNAMDLAVFDGVGEAARRAADDPDVGAVLVRGEGEHFSSGIDVNLLGEQSGDGGIDERFIARLQASFDAFEDCPKPTVAVIEGVCFGAGIQLALACHLRVVLPSAQLSVMEVRWGLVPDLGGTSRLPRLVGLGRATEMTVTARRVGADEAVRAGLAEVAAADHAEARDLVARLASAPGSVRRAIRLLRENLGRDREAAHAAERRAQLECFAGHDVGEAVRAHLEGRAPVFVGD